VACGGKFLGKVGAIGKPVLKDLQSPVHGPATHVGPRLPTGPACGGGGINGCKTIRPLVHREGRSGTQVGSTIVIRSGSQRPHRRPLREHQATFPFEIHTDSKFDSRSSKRTLKDRRLGFKNPNHPGRHLSTEQRRLSAGGETGRGVRMEPTLGRLVEHSRFPGGARETDFLVSGDRAVCPAALPQQDQDLRRTQYLLPRCSQKPCEGGGAATESVVVAHAMQGPRGRGRGAHRVTATAASPLPARVGGRGPRPGFQPWQFLPCILGGFTGGTRAQPADCPPALGTAPTSPRCSRVTIARTILAGGLWPIGNLLAEVGSGSAPSCVFAIVLRRRAHIAGVVQPDRRVPFQDTRGVVSFVPAGRGQHPSAFLMFRPLPREW